MTLSGLPRGGLVPDRFLRLARVVKRLSGYRRPGGPAQPQTAQGRARSPCTSRPRRRRGRASTAATRGIGRAAAATTASDGERLPGRAAPHRYLHPLHPARAILGASGAPHVGEPRRFEHGGRTSGRDVPTATMLKRPVCQASPPIGRASTGRACRCLGALAVSSLLSFSLALGRSRSDMESVSCGSGSRPESLQSAADLAG